MKKLSLEQIKEIELDLLVKFAAFCKEHKLRFYLAGGTLLGAVRHKGFIPWDDDIDVCMPRPDFEEFLRIFTTQEQNVKLLKRGIGQFDAPYAKLVRTDTLIKHQFIDIPIDRYMWIDILPVDGLPNDMNKVADIYRKCKRYQAIYARTNSVWGKGTALKRYIIKPIADLYGRKRCIDNIETLAAENPYESSEYVGVVTWGLYGVRERMLKTEFEKAVEVEFEGYQLPAFSCWDSYLHNLYGNYMELPPVEKRKTHDIDAYLVD